MLCLLVELDDEEDDDDDEYLDDDEEDEEDGELGGGESAEPLSQWSWNSLTDSLALFLSFLLFLLFFFFFPSLNSSVVRSANWPVDEDNDP